MTETMPVVTADQLADMFDYLDELRDSGVTNMFGARPYVQRAFPELSPKEAGAVLTTWMKTFTPDESPVDRARSALAQKDTP